MSEQKNLMQAAEDQYEASMKRLMGGPEEESDESSNQLRVLGRTVRSVQMEARAKGRDLGPVSANQILLMADKGELDGVNSVQTLRALVAKLQS